MTIHDILQKYWSFSEFRLLQEDIIRSVLEGKDTLALMPTGGGKSLCFQVPALLNPGICIVVSPLIALMKDQVENLKSRNIEAIAIVSGMGKREVDILLDNCIYGPVKFLYLSPERLLSDLVRERIRHMKVNLIAVDEAHCISQWGYDFRPSYLQLTGLRALHPDIPVLALTATATERVAIDIQEKLNFRKPNLFRKSFERKNLSYVVFNEENKLKKLVSIIKKVKGCGIVYVRNRRETQEVVRMLNQQEISSDFYHAGLESMVRSRKQEAWKNNQTRIIVATNAFGMGIDKPDVRFVIHLDLPESLEAYYQEAGRAGRDEKKAYAVLLYSTSDRLLLEKKLELSFPSADEIRQVYHHLGNYFQLAYEAGEGISFEFDIGDFCSRFKVDAIKAINCLKFLEHDQYIALSESIFLPSRLKIIVSAEDVYRFQIEHGEYDSFIKTVLRSYGGLYDQFVPVNESDLARRTGQTRSQVSASLHRLQELGLLSYEQQTDKPRLQYLKPRTDSKTMFIDNKYIEARKLIVNQQVTSVIQYAENNVCRNRMLLEYFGETVNGKCGVCDVCLGEKRKKNNAFVADDLTTEILQLLSAHHMSLDELVSSLHYGVDKERITIIRLLLDSGKIRTDGKKYYV